MGDWRGVDRGQFEECGNRFPVGGEVAGTVEGELTAFACFREEVGFAVFSEHIGVGEVVRRLQCDALRLKFERFIVAVIMNLPALDAVVEVFGKHGEHAVVPDAEWIGNEAEAAWVREPYLFGRTQAVWQCAFIDATAGNADVPKFGEWCAHFSSLSGGVWYAIGVHATLTATGFSMLHGIAYFLLALLPVIVFFSGMAMMPVLIFSALFVVVATPRAVLRMPEAALPQSRHLMGLLVLMFGWTLVTVAWSITPERSLSSAFRVLSIMALGVVPFVYCSVLPSLSPWVLRVYVGCCAFIGVLLLSEHLPYGGVIHAGFWLKEHFITVYDRCNTETFAVTRFLEKNVNRGLCALSVFLWPLIYVAGRTNDVRFTRRVMLAGGLMVVAMIGMHSLSAKVGLLAGVLTCIAIQRFPRVVPWALVVVLPVYLLSFPVLFLVAEDTVFANEYVISHLPKSAMHRVHIWHELMTQAGEKPLLGWGMDTSRAMPLSEHALNVLHLQAPPLHPHSPSLQILLEQGVVGLLLSTLALALLLRLWVLHPLMQDVWARATSGALIVAYFSSGVSSFGIWQSWWLATLWIAGICWRWFGGRAR